MVEDKSLLSNSEDMGQVLGALMLNGDLLYNTSYPLEKKDFIKEYAIVFTSVSNLIRQGIRQFDDDMVLEYICKYIPSWSGIYKEMYPNNDFVEKTLEKTKTFNFEYHYNNVRRMSYLRDLNENRFDVSMFYDVTGENTKLNREFEKNTLENLRKEFKTMVGAMDEKWAGLSSEDEKMSSSTITDEELDEVLDGDVEIGYKFPMGLEVLTHIFRGQLPQKYHLNMAGSGVGKIKCFIEKYLLNRKLGVIGH